MPELEHTGDISDRFEILVDASAEPTDIDAALAEFLITIAQQKPGARDIVSSTAAAAGPEVSSQNAAQE